MLGTRAGSRQRGGRRPLQTPRLVVEIVVRKGKVMVDSLRGENCGRKSKYSSLPLTESWNLEGRRVVIMPLKGGDSLIACRKRLKKAIAVVETASRTHPRDQPQSTGCVGVVVVAVAVVAVVVACAVVVAIVVVARGAVEVRSRTRISMQDREVVDPFRRSRETWLLGIGFAGRVG